jgi:hypothetical protein
VLRHCCGKTSIEPPRGRREEVCLSVVEAGRELVVVALVLVLLHVLHVRP